MRITLSTAALAATFSLVSHTSASWLPRPQRGIQGRDSCSTTLTETLTTTTCPAPTRTYTRTTITETVTVSHTVTTIGDETITETTTVTDEETITALATVTEEDRITATVTETTNSVDTVTATATITDKETITNTVTATATITDEETVTETCVPVTTTVTATIPPLPVATCNNAGFQVAYWPNPYVTTQLSSLLPERYKTLVPTKNSTTQSAGLSSTVWDTGNFYGFTPGPNNVQIALMYRGYFYAPVDSTYTFKVVLANDFAAIWTGPTAYSGYLRSNANIVAQSAAGTGVATNVAFTKTITAGTYLPIRIIAANGDAGDGALYLSITDAAGTVYLSTAVDSPYIIQRGCTGDSTPSYPLWGHES
ncbi:hypothetical protein TWF694_008459 [Orbilia ellipsospora]|uniref:PA14 domain-containing protein n=1 Tax=Orbilia ellipsospora TaxID=2528407 RepID=A0AAV9XMT3_9PEZI